MFNWYLNQVSKFIQNEKKRIKEEESEEFHAILNSTLNNLLIDIRRLDNFEFQRIKEKSEIKIKDLKRELEEEREKIIIPSAEAEEEKPEFERSAINKEEK